MDDILAGVLKSIYACGYYLAADDMDDIGPTLLLPADDAHPGLHHYHLGAAMMILSQAALAVAPALEALTPPVASVVVAGVEVPVWLTR